MLCPRISYPGGGISVLNRKAWITLRMKKQEVTFFWVKSKRFLDQNFTIG